MSPLTNKNTQPQVNFSGSNKKIINTEELVVFYGNEIRTKHISND